jgi:hypothetical protein
MIRSALDRTDANWDLQNYHLYGPFAALHGRVGSDYFVAGFQGYLNPLADFPYYIVKFILFPAHPVLVAALAGLPFGALIFIVFKIARIFLPQGAPWEAGLAAFLGLTGAVTLSEVGTTYDDILIADFLLLGLWAAARERHPLPWFKNLAGLAAGCAAGLKFTAIVFAPGLLLFCVMQAARRQAIQSVLGFALAGAIGFAASWGWWGWTLWRHFHNPFFPLFGHVFPSPWAPAMTVEDPRFFPRDAVQWLFYPFFWLQGRGFIVTEEPLRDPRFALVYVALAIRLAAMVGRRTMKPARNVLALWGFFAFGYVLWLIGFSILRYALPLEAISGIIVWTALRPFFQARFVSILCVICLVCYASTGRLSWGRIRYTRALVEAPIPVPPAGSLVFLQGRPAGFVVPYLYRPGSVFISLDTAPTPAEILAVRQRVRHAQHIFLLTDLPGTPLDMAAANAGLGAFGLNADEASCTPVHSPLRTSIRICGIIAGS